MVATGFGLGRIHFSRSPRPRRRSLAAHARTIGAVGERPFVDLEGRGPHEIAMQVVGAGFGDAYYVCEFPGSHVVYALTPGQLEAQWPKLYELQRALTDALSNGLPNGAASLANAATRMGLAIDRTADRITLRDGEGMLTAQLSGEHITNMTMNTPL